MYTDSFCVKIWGKQTSILSHWKKKKKKPNPKEIEMYKLPAKEFKTTVFRKISELEYWQMTQQNQENNIGTKWEVQ